MERGWTEPEYAFTLLVPTDGQDLAGAGRCAGVPDRLTHAGAGDRRHAADVLQGALPGAPRHQQRPPIAPDL